MVSSKLCHRSLHVLQLFGQIYEINQHLKVLVSPVYSYLLIQYKSMAQEVLFCMQGCFYLSALSKGFTFILARSCIYLFYFIRLNFPKTSLIPDRSCCMFVLFHLSALSNPCTGQDLSYNCQVGSMLLFRPTSFFQQFTLTPCILQDLGRNCVRTESLRRQNKTRMVSNTFLLYTSWCIYFAIHILSIKKD